MTDTKTHFLLKINCIDQIFFMRPTIAIMITSSQFVILIPKSNFNIKEVNNDKGEQNTNLCFVVKYIILLNID